MEKRNVVTKHTPGLTKTGSADGYDVVGKAIAEANIKTEPKPCQSKPHTTTAAATPR